MRVPQPLQRRHMVYSERLSSQFAQVGVDEHGPILAKTDEALVEGGVPSLRAEGRSRTRAGIHSLSNA
jgi:hypothetical protein